MAFALNKQKAKKHSKHNRFFAKFFLLSVRRFPFARLTGKSGSYPELGGKAGLARKENVDWCTGAACLAWAGVKHGWQYLPFLAWITQDLAPGARGFCPGRRILEGQ